MVKECFLFLQIVRESWGISFKSDDYLEIKICRDFHLKNDAIIISCSRKNFLQNAKNCQGNLSPSQGKVWESQGTFFRFGTLIYPMLAYVKSLKTDQSECHMQILFQLSFGCQTSHQYQHNTSRLKVVSA